MTTPETAEHDGSWTAYLRSYMTEAQRARFDAGAWVECDACAAKPGASDSDLCIGCLANRERWRPQPSADEIDELVNKICLRFGEARDAFRLAVKTDLLPFLRGRR